MNLLMAHYGENVQVVNLEMGRLSPLVHTF